MKLLLGLIVSVFFSSALFAQTGTLRGIVTDESGAIVPGAKITLTANAGTANTAVAGDDGSYSFTGITPGEYVVQASAPDLAVAPLKVMLRPGTNQFHGSGFFNFGSDFWNSRNPYAQQKAPFLLREYGGNLSGPMGKRASFFMDVRRDATDNGAIINGTTLDPVTLSIINPFTDMFRIPQRRFG